MDTRGGGDVTLELLMSVFSRRIVDLQKLILIRGVPSATQGTELGEVDRALRTLDHYLSNIKAYLQREAEALPKAKALIELSIQQQQTLQQISTNLPARLPGNDCHVDLSGPRFCALSSPNKEKKGKGPPPRWYINVDELSSLSSYMRGRLTLEKLNSAIDEMATFALANARLLAAPRKKLGEDLAEKVLELRDIAALQSVKGKHFFLETDMRGPTLKLDNTGKAILTVFRHLGRINEFRTGRQRVLVLLKA
ncbi:unnamed protein product [Sphagnum jensenii]|uniref:Spindle and kinetochore-associated protein 1 n=1 Tax=Sphagnum jensenii TaxID=128206 RepID=A0ABP0X378_9BRYO